MEKPLDLPCEVEPHIPTPDYTSVCARCRKRVPLEAFDFHHADPSTKSFPLTATNIAGKPWQDVQAEAAKCVLLCANCHRHVHFANEPTAQGEQLHMQTNTPIQRTGQGKSTFYGELSSPGKIVTGPPRNADIKGMSATTMITDDLEVPNTCATPGPNNSSVVPFDFHGNNVRAMTIGGEPWFVAADVCEVLGLTCPQRAYTRLPVQDKSYVPRTHVGMKPGRPVVLISKPGLFKLTIRSNMPDAIQFQEWICNIVLPALDKDGMYVMGEEKVVTGEMSIEEMTAKVLTYWQSKVSRLTEEKAALEASNAKLAPKAAITDLHCAKMDNKTVNVFVRTLPGVNLNETKKDLIKAEVLYHGTDGRVRVYAKYRDSHFVEKRAQEYGKFTIYPLAKGRELLVKLHMDGKLTLKNGYKVSVVLH